MDRFNPHPSCLLGATHARNQVYGNPIQVSILTQVVSWVRRLPHRNASGNGAGFNPHPSCLLGATRHHVDKRAIRQVSILTQVVSWVRRTPHSPPHVQRGVSILTQVVSWVRRSA